MIETVKSIWKLIEPKGRRQAVLVALLMLLNSTLEVIGIGLIFPLLKIVGDPSGSLADMPPLRAVYDALGFPDVTTFVVVLCIGTLLIFVAKNAVLFAVTFTQYSFVWGQLTALSTRLYRQYLNAPYSLFLRRNSANLTRNVTTSIQEMFGRVLLPLLQIGTEALVTLAILGFLVWFDPIVTLVAGLILGLTGTIFYVAARGPLGRWGRTVQQTNQERLQWANQAFSGVKEIKALGREGYFARRFTESTHGNSRARQFHAVLSQAPRVVLEMMTISTILVAIVLILVSEKSISEMVPVLGVFSLAIIRIMPSLNRIAGQMNNLRFGIAALDAISEDALHLPLGPDRAEADVTASLFTKELSIENASFRYDDAPEKALNGINLTVPKGTVLALVGASGAGKTTLADLILGLLEPQEGSILADGRDVRTDLAAWRASVGYIPQDTFLIDDSLIHNIALGVEDDRIDRAAIDRAVKLSHLEELVRSLPDGLETQVGERGVRLSGGQRQRIAIARALYHDPELIIMDEATSSLDNETEKAVADAIASLAGDKTLIIIAHRLSTIEHCDQVVFMDHGRIVETGTFDQLAARNDKFKRLVELGQVQMPAAEATV